MADELLLLARPEIVAMSAYRSARSEQAKGNIWLDANENPWNDGRYNRYPEPQPVSLISDLAALYHTKAERILVTRGSDEGIDLLVRLFCRAGQDQIMICPPTYGMYKVAAVIQGAGIIEVPLVKENNFSLDVTAVLQQWQPDIKLIFLCSPNNPTGNLLAAADILSLCQQLAGKAIIVVDEAYMEFSTGESLIKYLANYPNLVVLRTLSKAYGLAGIRCGATIANPVIIQLLRKIIAPYPIAQPIIDICRQRLTLPHPGEQVKIINEEKEKLAAFLARLAFVKKVWPSQANFLLFEVVDVKKVMAVCLSYGIVLRDRSNEYNLSHCLRVTIGMPVENKTLMKALADV